MFWLMTHYDKVYFYLNLYKCFFSKFILGIKDFSNWPTIPQVYINGEFVGGCDIMLQMHQSGDLIEELEKVGIRSALLDKENEEKKK